MSKQRPRRWVIGLGGLAAVLLIAWIIVYEPVTRNLLAQDALCNYCHLEWEFNPDVRLPATRRRRSSTTSWPAT